MALHHSPRIITDGLLLALDAGDKNSYIGSGTSWINLQNPSLSTSLSNGPTFDSSNLGNIRMDGTDDIIYGPSGSSFGPIPNHTFEMWVKTPGLGPGMSTGGLVGYDYGIISDITSGGNVRYYVYNTDNGYPGVYLFVLGSSGVNMFDNQWHHVICTRNSTTSAIYIDGQIRASGSGGGQWSGTTIWSSMAISIGNNPNDAYYRLNGNIGITRIYNTSFTQAMVSRNYLAQKSRYQ